MSNRDYSLLIYTCTYVYKTISDDNNYKFPKSPNPHAQCGFGNGVESIRTVLYQRFQAQNKIKGYNIDLAKWLNITVVRLYIFSSMLKFFLLMANKINVFVNTDIFFMFFFVEIFLWVEFVVVSTVRDDAGLAVRTENTNNQQSKKNFIKNKVYCFAEILWKS